MTSLYKDNAASWITLIYVIIFLKDLEPFLLKSAYCQQPHLVSSEICEVVCFLPLESSRFKMIQGHAPSLIVFINRVQLKIEPDPYPSSFKTKFNVQEWVTELGVICPFFYINFRELSLPLHP